MANYISVTYKLSGRKHVLFNKTYEGVFITVTSLYTKYDMSCFGHHHIIRQTANYIVVEHLTHYSIDVMKTIAEFMVNGAYTRISKGDDVIDKPEFTLE